MRMGLPVAVVHLHMAQCVAASACWLAGHSCWAAPLRKLHRMECVASCLQCWCANGTRGGGWLVLLLHLLCAHCAHCGAAATNCTLKRVPASNVAKPSEQCAVALLS